MSVYLQEQSWAKATVCEGIANARDGGGWKECAFMRERKEPPILSAVVISGDAHNKQLTVLLK